MTNTPPAGEAATLAPTRLGLSVADELILPSVRLRREHALPLLGVAVLLGLLTDALFWHATLGVNVPLWLGTGVVAVLVAGRRMGAALRRDRVAMLVAALACAAVFAWRDAAPLLLLNLTGCAILFAFALAVPRRRDARAPGFVAACVSCLSVAAASITSPFRLGERISWASAGTANARAASAIPARALLIGVPAFLVFALLFVAADAVFAKEVGNLIAVDIGRFVPHVAWFVAGAWLAVTALWSAIAVEPPPEIATDLPRPRRLRATEVAVILGPLVPLFTLFVIVQVRYLFGGAALVERSVDLTYAEYARRGFFELVMAAMLLLPLLTGVNWARRADAKTKTAFLVLSGALVALMFVIMLSAWQRLAMYRATFGLTELRFYTAATLPWLAAIFLWLAIAVVRDRPRWFFPGMVWASFIALGMLDVINPDALIARTNAGELASRRPFDAAYVASLSQDAVPPLLDRFEALPAAGRCELAASLLPRLQDDDGLRGWNFARQQARAAIDAHRGALERACEAPRT